MRWRCLTDLKFLAREIFGFDKIVDRVHDPVFKFYGELEPRTWCLTCKEYGPIFADLKPDTICMHCYAPRRIERDKVASVALEKNKRQRRIYLRKLRAEKPWVFKGEATQWQTQQECWLQNLKVLFAEYGEFDDIQLDPRGTFKSTILNVRCVQVITAFPDISMAYLSAAGNLPESFVNAIQARFLLQKGHPMTPFQEIWPEFCIAASKAKSGDFTTPMRRTISPDPTMESTSIESSLSGKHPWWIIFDDVVDNRNTANPTQIRKINKNVALSMYLRMRWSLVSFRGTRYSPIDAYGIRLGVKDKKAGKDSLKAAKPGRIKIMVRSAWTPKKGRDHLTTEELTESDVDLLFPEELPFSKLEKFRDDEMELFCAQMLNDPLGAQHGTFDPARFAQATKPFEQMPISGPTYIAWRFPFVDGQYYSAGAVGILDGFRLAIVDVARGSWKPSRLAFKVVELAKKWNVTHIQIEDTPGARNFEQAIKASAVSQMWKLDIDWTDFVREGVERASRVTRMEPLINATRLMFANHIGEIDAVTEQFCQFGMTDEKEIPEAVSLLIDKMPKIEANGPAEVPEDAMLAFQRLKQAALRNRVYGLGEYAHVEAQQPEPQPAPKPNHFALDDIMPGLTG